jgi:hypothetical protein
MRKAHLSEVPWENLIYKCCGVRDTVQNDRQATALERGKSGPDTARGAVSSAGPLVEFMAAGHDSSPQWPEKKPIKTVGDEEKEKKKKKRKKEAGMFRLNRGRG